MSYGGGRLVIDEPRRQVTAGGRAVTLTAAEPDPHAPGLIETVTGAGYRLAITRDHQPGVLPASW